MDNQNSYQRNIGLRLLSENVRWDKEDKFGKTLDRYLSHCVDEKFVTARQAIQGLVTVAQSTHSYDRKIRLRLSALSFDKYNTGQQNLLRKDVFDVQEVLSDSSGNTE